MRSPWGRRFPAARTVDSLHSLHSLARHIVEWAKSPNRSGRRRADRVLPAREGEVADVFVGVSCVTATAKYDIIYGN